MKAGSSHLETPKDTSQKTNITEVAAPHWMKRSPHLPGSHTPSEQSSGPAEHPPPSTPLGVDGGHGPQALPASSPAHLTEDALHLLHRLALVFAGQKAMLRKGESVSTTGPGPGCSVLGRQPGNRRRPAHLECLPPQLGGTVPGPLPRQAEKTQHGQGPGNLCVSRSSSPPSTRLLQHLGLGVPFWAPRVLSQPFFRPVLLLACPLPRSQPQGPFLSPPRSRDTGSALPANPLA